MPQVNPNETGEATESLLAECLFPALRILLLSNDEKVQNWLKKANWHLGDISPLDAIHKGYAEVVAEMLEERLTGQPS